MAIDAQQLQDEREGTEKCMAIYTHALSRIRFEELRLRPMPSEGDSYGDLCTGAPSQELVQSTTMALLTLKEGINKLHDTLSHLYFDGDTSSVAIEV